MQKLSFYLHKFENPILWRPASEELYQTILQYVEKNDQILEIGSGTGHISYMLAKRGFSVSMNEIRNDCLIQSMKVFQKNDVQAKAIKGDCMHITMHYDLIFSSGIVHCLWGKERDAFVKKMAQIGRKVILFYPDTEGGTKDVYQNEKQIPGVDDAKEYPIKDIPQLMKKYFKKVEYGELLEKNVGLPFKFIYVYGENRK